MYPDDLRSPRIDLILRTHLTAQIMIRSSFSLAIALRLFVAFGVLALIMAALWWGRDGGARRSAESHIGMVATPR